MDSPDDTITMVKSSSIITDAQFTSTTARRKADIWWGELNGHLSMWSDKRPYRTSWRSTVEVNWREKKSYSFKPMLAHLCSFLRGRMASPGGQSTDFLTASDRKACLCPLLKSEVGRWWMYFVMNKFFVGDIRNQKMPLKKNWDRRFGKHWAAFPPWQHWAGEGRVQQLPL